MPLDAPVASPDAIQQEVIDAQRAVLLRSLALTVAHEFNNLMTPVLALAEDSLGRAADPTAMRQALEVTQRQTEKAVQLARQLLELGTNHALRIEKCTVAKVVEEALSACMRPFPKDGIRVIQDIDPRLQVRARPQLLEQLVVTLLVNAQRAMRDRGGTLHITGRAVDGAVEVSISDSRPNVDLDWMRESVAPFLNWQSDRPVSARDEQGLSLMACRTIAEVHGARIEARPNQPQGCTFELRWPLD